MLKSFESVASRRAELPGWNVTERVVGGGVILRGLVVLTSQFGKTGLRLKVELPSGNASTSYCFMRPKVGRHGANRIEMTHASDTRVILKRR